MTHTTPAGEFQRQIEIAVQATAERLSHAGHDADTLAAARVAALEAELAMAKRMAPAAATEPEWLDRHYAAEC